MFPLFGTILAMLQLIGKFILLLHGFRLVMGEVNHRKMVIIFAPHTSNWDFMIGIGAILATGLKIRWFGKKVLFEGPQRSLLRRLGGIPVDRTKSRDTVTYFADAFAANDEFILALSPEGTRKRTDYWKSGFYHIARAAGVPIALSFFDYNKREVGIGKVIKASGNIKEDMDIIREFYKDKRGQKPEQMGPMRLKSE